MSKIKTKEIVKGTIKTIDKGVTFVKTRCYINIFFDFPFKQKEEIGQRGDKHNARNNQRIRA